MKKIGNMNIKELTALKRKLEYDVLAIDELIKSRTRAEAEKMAAASGMTLKELFGTRKPRAKKHRIVNPADRSQSYGGHGPKPAWVKQLEGKAA